MSDIQNIEIARYHDKIMKDMHRLMEKYRAIMAWDVPDNDPAEADRLILQVLREALREIEQGESAKKYF